MMILLSFFLSVLGRSDAFSFCFSIRYPDSNKSFSSTKGFRKEEEASKKEKELIRVEERTDQTIQVSLADCL